MALSFQANRDGINEIARSPGVRAALAGVAAQAKADAIAMSESFRETGDYINSFDIDSDTIDWVGEYPGRRGAAILVNHSDHAAAVEFGNGRSHGTYHTLGTHEAHHVLGRTLAALRA